MSKGSIAIHKPAWLLAQENEAKYRVLMESIEKFSASQRELQKKIANKIAKEDQRG